MGCTAMKSQLNLVFQKHPFHAHFAEENFHKMSRHTSLTRFTESLKRETSAVDGGEADLNNKTAFSVDELANELGISRPIAYQLVKRSDFPAIRISERRIIVPCDALKRWLDAQTGGVQ